MLTYASPLCWHCIPWQSKLPSEAWVTIGWGMLVEHWVTGAKPISPYCATSRHCCWNSQLPWVSPCWNSTESYLNINYSIIWYQNPTLQSPLWVSSAWFCASLNSNWLEVNDHQVLVSTRCIGLLFTARLESEWKLF